MRPRAKTGLTRRNTWLARYIPDPFKFFFSSEAKMVNKCLCTLEVIISRFCLVRLGK